MAKRISIWAGLLGCLIALPHCGGSPDDATGTSEDDLAAAAPIANFHVVKPGLYRGAHPDAAGLAYLHKMGVHTIVNLESTALFEPASTEDVAAEKAGAAKLGIVFDYRPLSSYLPVDDHQVNLVMATLHDPSSGKIYVHCTHGQDRTGLIIGLERVEQQHWTPRAAYDEMKKLGFHPILEMLNHYFEERTGFED